MLDTPTKNRHIIQVQKNQIKFRNSPTQKKKVVIIQDLEKQETKKKNNQKKFKRNNPFHNQYLSFLQDQKNDSMIHSFYSVAQKKDKIIKQISKNLKKQKIRSLSSNHLHQKQSLKAAHMKQVENFKKVWKEIFKRNKIYEMQKISQFQRMRQFQIEITKTEVLRKCKSIKPSVKMMELRDIQRYQKDIRNQEKITKYTQLKKLRQQKKQKKIQCEQEAEKIYKRIVQLEEKRLSKKLQKKYNSFIERLDEIKKQNMLAYKKQQSRLKRKYRNVLRNLKHDQRMQKNYFMQNYENNVLHSI